MIALRESLISTAQALSSAGLNTGTAGNLSVRAGAGFLITPSGMPAAAMKPSDLVWLGFDGSIQGQREPSSEWRLHQDILRGRPEVNAVIHSHAMFATTLACLRLEVPAFHYLIAVTGASRIRCAPYTLFGTQAFSDTAVQALADSKACLLANHGMVVLGADLNDALRLTIEVEILCERYWRARQLGDPAVLSEAEMAAVFERFKTYGQWATAAD